MKSLFPFVFLLVGLTDARPLVRNIRSTQEFDRLLEKHGSETGLPVVVDFYSDGCGPCRMMAPIYKKLAQEVGQDKAVFVKVDTNVQRELSGRYRIQSLPTFQFFLHGKKWDQFSGAGEGQLRQLTQQVIRQSEMDNVILTEESLAEYYKEVEPSKTAEDIAKVYSKCADMMVTSKKSRGGASPQCVSAAANQLSRRLKKKYKKAPRMVERFTAEARSPDKKKEGGGDEPPKQRSSPGGSSSNSQAPTNNKKEPNLHLASDEQLREELERRAKDEEEDEDEEELFPEYAPGDFPERVVIIGGGPAGMSAAIYAARAGLTPVVVAPSVGGQLQGKGVVVENFPGLWSSEMEYMGPDVVVAMKRQAAAFGAVFENAMVESVNTTVRPLLVRVASGDNTTKIIDTHSIIVATGAESNWLNIPGEYDLRGGGVSSCATCDGHIFSGKNVIVVGGGDAAMEDALVLARTSKSVTLVHRRDAFRASKVLAQRVIEHPGIQIKWNTVVTEIVGETVDTGSEDVNLDEAFKVVKGVKLMDTITKEKSSMPIDAVFVAIGHTPATKFLEGIVEFNPDHKGYVKVENGSTKTSIAGIFAAGDVSDAVYRQAITSAGSGAAAALDAERWLSEEGLGNEAAELEAELLAELSMEQDNSSREAFNAYDAEGAGGAGMKESIKSEL